MEKQSTLELVLLGETFVLKVDQSPERFQAIVRFLQEKIKTTAAMTRTEQPLRLALLTALLLAEDALNLAELQAVEQAAEAEQITQSMLQVLERALQEPETIDKIH